MKKILSIFCFISLLVYGSLSHAEEVASSLKAEKEISFFAVVNGVHLPEGLLELSVKNAVAEGQKDTPALRNNLKQELINRELLAQEAEKMGLEKKIDLSPQYIQLKQSLLIQAMVQDYLSSHPITEAVLRSEYDRQTASLGAAGTSVTQYLISQIIVTSQSVAIGIESRISQGEAFDKLAKQYSIDNASKRQGGQVGWVTLAQLPKSMADVINSLAKGGHSAEPISLNGSWLIVKLDDKRDIKTRAFNEVKPQLEQSIIQNYLVDSVKILRQKARISQ
ncbi:hypothetical protein G6705_08390 [Polynucleobacter paneuropaeus]|nr:hypothetical protein [Polynucleobacter paneuropaeus]